MTGGVVENVQLLNENLNGTNYRGGVVGQLIGGTIQNVYTSGTIVSSSEYAGGIVGAAFAGLITDSSSSANVTSSVDAAAGGITGLLSGTISDSYSTGNITGTLGSDAGGIAGASNGTITNTYSTGTISAQGNAGGIVGFASGGSTQDSYSTGVISSSTGGVIGSGTSAVNSYIDSQTSGVNGGNTTASLMNQSTFTGWDFANTWGIINGQSYPYLLAFYPTAPTALSGLSAAPAGQTVKLALNGTPFDSTTTSNNGFFYFLEGNNVITGINKSIGSDTALIYIDSGTALGNAVANISNGGSLSGMNINAADTVTLGSSNTDTITPTEMATAEGSISDPDILYSVSGNDITLGNATNPNVNFTTTPTTTFVQSGNVESVSTGPSTTGSSNITFNGPLSLTSPTLVLNGGTNGVITLSSINGNNFPLTIDNNNAGSTISGDITALAALILGGTGTGTLTLTGSSNQIGGAVLNAGALVFNNAAGSSTIGGLSGTGALTIQNGTVEIAGNNSGYSGFVTLNNGEIETDGVINPLGSNNLTFNSGTLNALVALPDLLNPIAINGSVTFSGNNITLGSAGGVNVSSGAVLTLNGITLTSAPALTLNNAGLEGSGSSAFDGAINLGNGTSDSLGATAGGTLTLTGNINGAAALAINGPGSVIINGNLGSVATPLTSVDSTNSLGRFTGSAYTIGNQTYGAPLQLSADSIYDSTNGAITFNNTIDGGYNLSVNSQGTTTFNAPVGSNAQLASLTVNSSATDINGGSVSTSGNQNYPELVTLGAPTTLTANTVTMSDGIQGNQMLNLDVVNAALTGPFDIQTLTADGQSTGSNIIINNTGSEIITLTGQDTGTLSGIDGIGNGVDFTNLSGLSGNGGNTTYVIDNGGSVTGNIVGTGTNNTLIDNNPDNVFNITGVGTGTISGVGGTFSNIQNIIGSGTTGALLNELNLASYGSPVTVKLDANKYDGSVMSGGTLLMTFKNINYLVASAARKNPLILTTAELANLTKTGLLSGVIGDPVDYSGFVVQNVGPEGVPQATTEENPYIPDPSLIQTNSDINSNLANIEYTLNLQDQTALNLLKIKPNCSGAQ